jgi:flavin-dependent dehydrogenase
MSDTVVVVGGGPGGLRCAKLLADCGARIVLLEKNSRIGPKVCAGGITEKGLLAHIPRQLIEKSFTDQVIETHRQLCRYHNDTPLIATVNRTALGAHMAREATTSGVRIIKSARVTSITNHSVHYVHNNKEHELRYHFLIGADGALSPVRSFCRVPSRHFGVGIKFTIEAAFPEMVWNFDPYRFQSGYSWIFPHAATASVGVYRCGTGLSPVQLRARLSQWLAAKKIDVGNSSLKAARVNCDYRGFQFGRCFLVGEAAGLVSPITGEGIYPALVSAQEVSRLIVDPHYEPKLLWAMVKKYRMHRILHTIANLHTGLTFVLSECFVQALKRRVISPAALEMATG